MNSVFNYVNYRRFLKVVIEGKRNLSSKTIDKFANALGLRSKQPRTISCVQMFKFQGQPAFTATANGNATVKQFIL
jgi:hypothetical protein